MVCGVRGPGSDPGPTNSLIRHSESRAADPGSRTPHPEISHSCDVATFVERIARNRRSFAGFCGAWNSHSSHEAMTAHFGVYLLLLAAPSGSTQPAALAPGDIRSSGCGPTGRKAAPVACAG